MKLVLNECYGGFGLSYEAQYLYLQAKGQDAYFYADVSSYDDYKKKHKYKLVTLNDIQKLQRALYIYCTPTFQGEVIDEFPKDVINARDLDRTDPALVAVVEVMGSKAASGRFSSLQIEEIPDGTLYKIDEYDGLESLITQEDDDWLLAKENVCSEEISTNIKGLWSLIKPTTELDPDLAFKI